ncbi:hypothetical protein B0H14DRAFT_2565353 [Mycena olivaceomarginata]|nr:hypothetical protein B0H14DRAFT_2565353 [Mycena olivaceomarginata]
MKSAQSNFPHQQLSEDSSFYHPTPATNVSLDGSRTASIFELVVNSSKSKVRVENSRSHSGKSQWEISLKRATEKQRRQFRLSLHSLGNWFPPSCSHPEPLSSTLVFARVHNAVQDPGQTVQHYSALRSNQRGAVGHINVINNLNIMAIIGAGQTALHEQLIHTGSPARIASCCTQVVRAGTFKAQNSSSQDNSNSSSSPEEKSMQVHPELESAWIGIGAEDRIYVGEVRLEKGNEGAEMYKRGPSEQEAERVEGGRGTSGRVSGGGKGQGAREGTRGEGRDKGRGKGQGAREGVNVESRSRARCEPMSSSCGAPDIALVNSSSQNEAARKLWIGALKREEGAGGGTEEEGEGGDEWGRRWGTGESWKNGGGGGKEGWRARGNTNEQWEEREERTHAGRARESSRVVLWASETRGRTAELKLCSVSGVKRRQRVQGVSGSHVQSRRGLKGEEGEGSREKKQGTRDEGRGRVSVARGCGASNDEEGRRREGGERRGAESSCVLGAIRAKQ